MADLTIPDGYAGKRAPLRAVEPPLNDILRAAEQPAPRQPDRAPEPPKPTWLETIAYDVAQLTYGEMKDLARGVLGKDDQAEIIVLADRLHEWAQKTKVQQ